MKSKTIKINKILAFVVINILCLSIFASFPSKAETIEPQDNQYIEFRAVKFEPIEGKDRQLIVEIWSNDLDIKGFDIRYQYDDSVISHSNITTNEYTDDETEFFDYSNANSGFLDLFTIPGESFTRMVVSLLPEEERTSTSEKIVDRGQGIGEVLDTSGGFLIGKMSFRTTLETIPSDLITLLPIENTSPETGIKVNFNGADSYEAQSLFRFTDDTASKDADLSNLIVSSGIVDEVNPENSTYKEYNLTPNFEKDTLSYQMELLEYVDELNIKAIQSDEKATMKIKVPKRDDDGNLVYDAEGTSIIYEEKEMIDKIPIEVTLNKLGEPDTNIKVIVTAENGRNTKEYNLVVKRPYATIKGNIFTAPTVSLQKYKSDIRVYKSDDVSEIIDWSTVSSKGMDKVHDKLIALKSQDFVTNDDGTYDIKIIPGTYDILLDKVGYLDHIYVSRTVNVGDTLDLGYEELYAGDLNKDGNIQLQDLSILLNVFGKNSTDSDYDFKFDFNEDGQIQLQDYALVLHNFTKTRLIE